MPEAGHVEDDAVSDHGLAASGVALPSGGDAERDGVAVRRAYQGNDVVYGGGIKYGEWGFVNNVAVIGGS